MKRILLIIAVVALACGCKRQGGIVFNEICGKDADGDEWIEVANGSDRDINVKGYKLVKYDKEGIDKTIYNFPDSIIKPGAVFVVNGSEIRAKIGKNGIPYKRSLSMEILDAHGRIVDVFDSKQDLGLKGHPEGSSYARIPNVVGEWTLCGSPTYDAANVNERDVVPHPEHEASDFDDEEDDETAEE